MKTYEEMVAAMISNSPETDTNAKEESDERVLAVATPAKTRKYNTHIKSYSSKWEEDPNYRGWVHRSQRGDGHFFCLACKQHYACGKSELDKHASSKKHFMNLRNMSWNDDFTINSTDVNTNMSFVSVSSPKADLTRIDPIQELSTSSTSIQVRTSEFMLCGFSLP